VKQNRKLVCRRLDSIKQKGAAFTRFVAVLINHDRLITF